MKRIEIEIDGVVAEAELLEDNAPKTTAAFWGGLPAEARLSHSKWSGRACGFAMASLGAVRELEHPVCSIYPGTIVARPDRGEVLLTYGAAEYRSALGVEYCTRIARLVGDPAGLAAVLARMHDEGDKTIRIRRAGAR
jgi:Protein of unknown function (DUF3830)